MDTTRRVIWATVIILAVWVAVYIITSAPVARAPQQAPQTGASSAQSSEPALADIAYNVSGTNYAMHDGVASIQEPNSSAKDTLRIYQSTRGDLIGNGDRDTAVILINTTGGSGVFYYLAAVLSDGTTTPAVFLGDRIATQGLTISNGTIMVHYLDREASQPFSAAPTVAKSATYRLVNGILTAQTP